MHHSLFAQTPPPSLTHRTLLFSTRVLSAAVPVPPQAGPHMGSVPMSGRLSTRLSHRDSTKRPFLRKMGSMAYSGGAGAVQWCVCGVLYAACLLWQHCQGRGSPGCPHERWKVGGAEGEGSK